MDQRYNKLIFTDIPHGIFTVDANRRITSFNPAAEGITGWTEEEVLGRPCSEIFHSSHCETQCFLKDSIEAGESHRDREVTIAHRDGEDLPVAVSTAALHDDDGAVLGGVEMFRDLKEIHSLRRQLTGAFKTGNIISKSAAMRGVRQIIPMVAQSDSTVLIQGEPGTGKEVVAQNLYAASARSSIAKVPVIRDILFSTSDKEIFPL